MTSQQVQDYLNRIDATASTAADIQLLKHLQAQHLYHIPFENLDIHYGPTIHLDIDRIFEKVIYNKRGGFCYELNGIFYELLKALGFQVQRICGSVHNSKTQAYGHPKDHLAIIVYLDGQEYLADVGYGEFALLPLLIELESIQTDPRGTFRMVEHKDHMLRIEKMGNQQWKPEYIFDKEVRDYAYFQEGCTYHQFNPESVFTQKKTISLARPTGRITLTEKVLKISAEDQVDEKPINSDKAFFAHLKTHFGIQLEDA